MQIIVNGEPREVPPTATVAWLIADLKLAGRPCAAARWEYGASSTNAQSTACRRRWEKTAIR